LIGNDTGIPTTLEEIIVFGAAGLVIGPVVVALILQLGSAMGERQS